MNDDQIPDAVVRGRRVAIALLMTAMGLTLVTIIALVAWWATRPVVV